jgi:hypothetical protein
MNVDTLISSLTQKLGVSETELIYKGLLAYIQNEIRLAELEIANIRDRYGVFSKEELYEAIKNDRLVAHPAWEDYIIWKNKLAHIDSLHQLVTNES